MSSALFDWRLSLYAAIGTLILFLPCALASADLGEFFYLLIAVPAISLVLLGVAIAKKRRQRLSILAMLIVFWIVSAVLLVNFSAIRDSLRWFFWANAYKAETLRRAPSGSGELPHAEWDGWGFTGFETTVYLVFDESDSLPAVPRSHPPGRFRGIPCAVDRIRRLERSWYAVTFYTGADWSHCG